MNYKKALFTQQRLVCKLLLLAVQTLTTFLRGQATSACIALRQHFLRQMLAQDEHSRMCLLYLRVGLFPMNLLRCVPRLIHFRYRTFFFAFIFPNQNQPNSKGERANQSKLKHSCLCWCFCVCTMLMANTHIFQIYIFIYKQRLL